MNKIYKVKFCKEMGIYVAVSELAKNAGKVKSSVKTMLGVAALGIAATALQGSILSTNAYAAECVARAGNTGWDVPNGSCEISGQNLSTQVGWTSVLRLGVRSDANVSINGDLGIDATTNSARYTRYDSTVISLVNNSHLNANNLNLAIRSGEPGKTVTVRGVTAWGGSSVTANDLTANVVYSGESNAFGDRGQAESYGIQVGTGITGEDRRAGTTSKITVNNADITVTNSAATGNGFFGFATPYLLSGIRVIRADDNAGSNAIYESTGKTTINAFDSSTNGSGDYIVGVYVSGENNKVLLNDSEITLGRSGQHSSALKIGKTRAVGAGGASIESKGHMILDSTAESRAPTVRLLGNNSSLKADFDTSSSKIISGGTALQFDNQDYLQAAAATGQSIALRNTDISTTSETASLIVNRLGMRNSTLTFSGDDTSVRAADKGWLISAEGTNDLVVNGEDAGEMTGLSYKTSNPVAQLNVNLNNQFTWHLNKKDTDTTASLDNLNLSNGAVLNGAYESTGTNNYTISATIGADRGNVRSDKGVINLSHDKKAGDVLHLEAHYEGKNEARLQLDTLLLEDDGNNKGNSVSDVLHIVGNSAGQTNIQITPVEGSHGGLTQQGIKVVQVDGDSPADNFRLIGDDVVSNDSISVKAPQKHQFTYRLYQGTNNDALGTNGIPENADITGIDSNDWYLRSSCTDGTHTVGGGAISTKYDGLGCITDDTITIEADGEVAKVEGAGGADTIIIRGKVNGDVYGGNAGVDNSAAKDGNDSILIEGSAVVSGTVFGQQGDDSITWTGDSAINGIDGGDGSDTATVSSSKYDGTQLLDGGDDAEIADDMIDTLNLNGIKVSANGDKIINWEVINLNNTQLDLAGTLTTSASTAHGLTISTDSVLGVTGTASTIVGHVKNSGTIDLHKNNSSTGQTLNINGDYTGDNGVVKMNTVWNAPGDANGANSTSDVLNISGKATGSTKVIPVKADGTENIIEGNIVKAAQIVNTIPVVNVGEAGDTAFTGTAQTTGAGEVQLAKRTVNGKDEYFWTLAALPPQPQPEPPQPQPEPP
ncbi:autotransporter outer membrane beta-barrel domain-containing protein, partial [Conservatibacter flavescens]